MNMPEQPPHFSHHAVDLLRQFCESQSSRVFNARGVALKRCSQCLLGLTTCICPWRKPGHASIEFVLLMHRDEVHKPTNTGRLIADLYPQQTHAFLWDRTQPSAALLGLINDPGRHCQLIFPPREGDGRTVETQLSAGNSQTGISPKDKPPLEASQKRIPTVILLDGTWKQASKMYSQSQWLKHLPSLDLSSAIEDLNEALGHYKVRQACENGQLATAEAGALCLYAAQDAQNTRRLLDYFTVFNEHYVATRMNRRPTRLDAHIALAPDQTGS